MNLNVAHDNFQHFQCTLAQRSAMKGQGWGHLGLSW